MWGGGFDGPCTAAYGPGGVVLVSGLPDYDGYFFDDVDAFRESPLSSAVEVCLTADLVGKLGRSCLVYSERCSLDLINWSALGTGIASPYGYARALRLLLTARRCSAEACFILKN